jgi:hypothetical protein
MDDPQGGKAPPGSQDGHKPFTVRLPGFVSDRDIGLGDAVKRLTGSAGLRPCGSCERRAVTMNRWIRFTGGRSS